MIQKIQDRIRKFISPQSQRFGKLPAAGESLEAVTQAALDKKNRSKWILAFALPIIVQNIVQHMQMVIDRAFLGNLDPTYLAAIGNVMTPYNALGLFLFASSTGLTILVAQKIGANKVKQARDLAESSFVFATLLSSSLFVLWLFGAQAIFGLLGASGPVKAASVSYVRIMSISLIFTGVDITAAAVLQGVGYTKPIMITGIIKNLLNIFFDWVLIFGVLGFPALGLEGAALATLIANVSGSLLLLAFALRTKKMPFRYSIKALLKPKWALFSQTMRLGLPSGFESLLWFTGQLVLVRIVNTLDPLAMGIVSLVQGIYLLALFVYLGFARAATTMVGQLWGAQKFKEGKIAGFHAQKMGLVVSFTWASVMMFFPEPLARIFSQDPLIIQESITMIRLAALFVNFQAINVIMGHAIRGTGDTKWMLYSQIFGTIFVVGMSSFLIIVMGFGLAGVYITLIIDEVFRSLVNYLRFHRGHNPFRKSKIPENIIPKEAQS